VQSDLDRIDPAESVIAVAGLTHRYPGRSAPALRGVDFDVPRGAMAGLIGPNGAGKSTLIGVLTGVLPVQAGTVQIAGRAPVDARELRRSSALVPQACAFYDELTGRENLRFFADVHGLSAVQYEHNWAYAVDVAGLGEVVDRRAGTYSGGLQRRLNLALGLINRPQILYLDEPTVGVDAQSRHYLLRAIGYLRDQGTTIVYTSHYMEEVEDLCDRIAVIDRGRVVATGPTDELLARFGTASMEIRLPQPASPSLRDALQRWLVRVPDEHTLVLAPQDTRELRAIVEALAAQGVAIERLRHGGERLADVYLRLITGEGPS
jgi:ABC-2 type transport system ATP-binding protein